MIFKLLMFVDEAKISVIAGKGGDGAVSFRHEKYVEFGGPDGGDGGDGGSVIIRADSHIDDLSQFNCMKKFKAENGQNGMGKKKHGKSADDLILFVPLGTQIYYKNALTADLKKNGDQETIAQGGRGGFGNQHFATSIKQAPRWSKKGEVGENKNIRLELKIIADIGLIGMPNVGKSTLLSVLTNAKPKIADYCFTTLEPNLGAIKSRNKTITIADIPGLIEGASEGKGLGDKFLRHVERTKKLIHLIDANSDDVVEDYLMIRKELLRFSNKLCKKEEIVVLSKSETVNNNILSQKIKKLKNINLEPMTISSVTKLNLKKLIKAMS